MQDEPVQCFSEGRRGCEISCEFQKGVCASTFEYATTDHGRNMTISGVAGQQLVMHCSTGCSAQALFRILSIFF